jgi:formate/nitrite transporter FocA (FNT family)
MEEFIKKSAAASLLISLGVAVLLKIGNPLGPFLFAFGLLGVCRLGLELFTGKCGFCIQDGIPAKRLVIMLAVNLVSGYIFGLALGYCSPDMAAAAAEKVGAMSFTPAFFLRSVFCGIIMYLCVAVYRGGSDLGILFGIPLFIFAGFQHCIANVIVMGAARSFHPSLVLCILGNFAGSLLMWYLAAGQKAQRRQ